MESLDEGLQSLMLSEETSTTSSASFYGRFLLRKEAITAMVRLTHYVESRSLSVVFLFNLFIRHVISCYYLRINFLFSESLFS